MFCNLENFHINLLPKLGFLRASKKNTVVNQIKKIRRDGIFSYETEV